MSIPLQPVTSLRRRAQTSYWLRHMIVVDGDRSNYSNAFWCVYPSMALLYFWWIDYANVSSRLTGVLTCHRRN